MKSGCNRRRFLAAAGIAAASFAVPSRSSAALNSNKRPGTRQEPRFKISLAEWSLHRTIFDKKITNLDFPRVSKEEFGIEAVEYVNQFFKDRANDLKYLMDLKSRCDDVGVKSLLIMVDGEGQLGNPNEEQRKQAV